MTNFQHLFQVGQLVYFKNDDFDAIREYIPCLVKETYPDYMIITDVETDTDLRIEEGFNLNLVYPEYNLPHLRL